MPDGCHPFAQLAGAGMAGEALPVAVGEGLASGVGQGSDAGQGAFDFLGCRGDHGDAALLLVALSMGQLAQSP